MGNSISKEVYEIERYKLILEIDELEKKVTTLESNSEAVIRLEERLKNVQTKTDEIYRHIISSD